MPLVLPRLSPTARIFGLSLIHTWSFLSASRLKCAGPREKAETQPKNKEEEHEEEEERRELSMAQMQTGNETLLLLRKYLRVYACSLSCCGIKDGRREAEDGTRDTKNKWATHL